ncbi:MAG: CpsB/CapC family capsule biosynthesis tyrosine phosphatase [Gemmatimonadota bacterium]
MTDRRPPPELADLHCHLVPGVDDGVPTLAEAIRWLARFRDRGIRRVVTTPHLPSTEAGSEYRDRVERTFSELRAAAAEEVPEVELGLAFEVRLMEGGSFPTRDRGLWLGPAGHVLVEYSRFTVPPDPLLPLRPLLEAGLTPVLAHPERFRPGSAPEDWTDRLVELGVLLCPNAGSLLDRYGPRAAARAAGLLRRGRAALVASDHHGRPSRSDDLRHALERLATWTDGEAAARVLLADNPTRIIEGRDPRPAPPASPPERSHFDVVESPVFGFGEGGRG